MTEILKDVFARRRVLLKNEDCLLRKARQLYNQGFCSPEPGQVRISAAQMAAVGEKIQTANSFEDAVSRIERFLNKQLQKLREREKRTGRPESWQLPSTTKNKLPLGDILKDYIAKQSYLSSSDNLDEISRLDLLRRFWSYFHGLYRYERTLGLPMKFIEKLVTSTQEKAK